MGIPVWSKNSSNLEVSEKIKYFNADELIERTGYFKKSISKKRDQNLRNGPLAA